MGAVPPAAGGMGGMFTSAMNNGGLGAPQANTLGGQQVAAQPLATVQVPQPPVSPPKITAPPRPVYRHTARSTAKVSSRSWAKPDPQPSHNQIGGSTSKVVIPMHSKKDHSLINSMPSADTDRLYAEEQAARKKAEAQGAQDPRLQLVSPEKPVSTPGGLYGLALTPVPATATPTTVSQLSPVPSKNLDTTPQRPSPVVQKYPANTLNVTGREEAAGPEVEINPESGNHKLQVYDLRVHNEHGSILFEGMTDLTKVDINEAVSLHHLNLDMYPHGAPPKGQGLNKPATVKLYQMKPCKNDKSVAPEKFEKMLKRSLSNTKSEHVSYQEEDEDGQYAPGGKNGYVWTFKVENFDPE